MVASSPIIIMPYEHIEADFSSIKKGLLQIHAPKATVKKVSWKDSGLEDITDVNYKFKGCKTVEDVARIEPNYNQIANWNELLSDLENGTDMFHYCENLTTFASDLSSLTNGDGMFYNCSALTTFISDSSGSSVNLNSLTNGNYMFKYCSNLTTFTSNLSSLTNGRSMFEYCGSLTTFNSDLSALTNGREMFSGCYQLATFTSDLSSLIYGYLMFDNCSNLKTFNSNLGSLADGEFMFFNCTNLTSFNSDLSSLTHGVGMFSGCKLNTTSIKNIAETINIVSNNPLVIDIPIITISTESTSATSEEETYFQQIRDKGWELYVELNGNSSCGCGCGSCSSCSSCGCYSCYSLATTDETGETTSAPVPYYAKPVPSDEEHAQYVDSQGNFFNILGGNLIYVDDPESYGMFLNREDAARQMRLTKIGEEEIQTA